MFGSSKTVSDYHLNQIDNIRTTTVKIYFYGIRKDFRNQSPFSSFINTRPPSAVVEISVTNELILRNSAFTHKMYYGFHMIHRIYNGYFPKQH
jgi:hypothetical protein